MQYKDTEFRNRRIDEVLPDGSWTGWPCVIIGGGPSLTNFDFNRLRGWRTIGVNRVFERIEPTIIFSMDTRYLWWLMNGEYGPDIKERFLKARSYRVWLLTYRATLPGDIFYIHVHRNYQHALRYFSYRLEEGIGHGNSSGCAAINLAFCLGANPIYLLGFDCKHQAGRSHWHNGHIIAQEESTAQNFAAWFEYIEKYTRAKHVKVINLNPDSALEAFPKKPAEEVL